MKLVGIMGEEALQVLCSWYRIYYKVSTEVIHSLSLSAGVTVLAAHCLVQNTYTHTHAHSLTN